MFIVMGASGWNHICIDDSSNNNDSAIHIINTIHISSNHNNSNHNSNIIISVEHCPHRFGRFPFRRLLSTFWHHARFIMFPAFLFAVLANAPFRS